MMVGVMMMMERTGFREFVVGCYLLLTGVHLTHESTLQQLHPVSVTTGSFPNATTFDPPLLLQLNSSEARDNSTTELDAASSGNASVSSPPGTITISPNSSRTFDPKVAPVYLLPRVVRDLGWVIALITLASGGIVLVLIIEIWLLIKTMTVPEAMRFKSMWLGQVLLFAVFCSYLTLFAFLPFSSPVTCGIIRFCVGICYALCFSVLLLKLLLILGSKSLGYDVSTGFQATLLFFVWAVQLVINIQWLITVPPRTTPAVTQPQQSIEAEPWGSCDPGFASHVQSLVYVMFLVVLCTLLSLGTHENRANHREGMFIGLASGVTIALWIVWILVGFLMNDPSWHEPCIAFGLLATVTWILLIMFVPKLQHLHSMTASEPLAGYYGRSGAFPKNTFDGPATLTPDSRRVMSRREEESISGAMRFGIEIPNGSNELASSSRPNEYNHNLNALYLRHPGGPVTYGIKLPGLHSSLPSAAVATDDPFRESPPAMVFASASQPHRLSSTKPQSNGPYYQQYKPKNCPSPRITSGGRFRQ